MGKLGSAAKAQESEMSQKPQGVGKEMAPHHTPASPAVYRRILCGHLHTELAALHCSTPHFLLPDFLQPPLYQHYPNSPNPGLSICGISEQLSGAGTLGTFYSSVLRFPCTRTPEFLLKDGELAFSQPRSRGTSFTQALKSWLLYFYTFIFSFLLSYRSLFVFLSTHTCVDLQRSFHFFLTQSRSRNPALWFALLRWNKPICLWQGSHTVTTSYLKSDAN